MASGERSKHVGQVGGERGSGRVDAGATAMQHKGFGEPLPAEFHRAVRAWRMRCMLVGHECGYNMDLLCMRLALCVCKDAGVRHGLEADAQLAGGGDRAKIRQSRAVFAVSIELFCMKCCSIPHSMQAGQHSAFSQQTSVCKTRFSFHSTHLSIHAGCDLALCVYTWPLVERNTVGLHDKHPQLLPSHLSLSAHAWLVDTARDIYALPSEPAGHQTHESPGRSPMSLLRRSTGRAGELFADELSTEFRPMTSHARMEGSHARAKGSEPQDKTPRQRRKAFLPQLSQTKAFMLNTHRSQHHEDGDEEVSGNVTDVDTDAFRQAMWAGQANILVTVRLRPHLGHDRDNEEIVKVLDHKLVVVLDAASGSSEAAGGHQSPVRRHTSHPIRKIRNTTAVAAASRRSREKRFAFDYVFTPEDGQQAVYCHTTKFLIHGVLNGFNATVFAYGCTGAGKTYTMLGTPDQPGIMALTLDDLFQNITRVHTDPLANVVYKVTVSFLEVYNENIRDLLVSQSSSTFPGGATNEFLDLREDPVKGSIIAGISEIEACNALEVMQLLRKGNKHRSQEATAANAVSSRSHAVLQVLVEQRERTISTASSTDNDAAALSSGEDANVTTVIKFGKLSLVDLAGSERAAVTQNRGQRLLEGANINRSLLALGNCINALGEKGASAASFVPYRDSKLTRLLKDSLGGNCRTVMIANISLAAASLEETLNTLKYANRAKNIKTTVTRNVLSVDHHITEYVGVISGLRDEIAALKRQLVRQQQQQNGDLSPEIQKSLPSQQHHSSVNNNSDEGESAAEEQPPSAEAIQKQLQDVRQHVTRYFAERMRLREVLLKIDYQIGVLVDQAPVVAESDDAGYASEKLEGMPRPEVEVLQSMAEKNQDESALAGSPRHDESMALNAKTGPDNGVVSEQALEELEALTCHKQAVLHELARLETRMEDFRSAILSSSSLADHTMFREILLMEFRVGNLEIEKMELQLAKELRDLEIGSRRMRIGAQPGGDQRLTDSGESEQLKLPLLSQLSPKFSSAQAPKPTTNQQRPPDRDSSHSSQRGSPPPRSNYGFMDDLRDRFHALKSSHEERDHSQRQPADKQPKGSAASSPLSSAIVSNSRKQWGISLASTSLPYIRLKKKTSTDNLSSFAAGASGFHQTAAGVVPGVAGSSSSSTVTAPYLRVLKHRRKSQSSKKSTISSAHRK